MKKLLLIVVALCFVACASPGKIQRGKFISEKFGYTVKIPQGWNATTEIPTFVPKEHRANFSFAIINPETKGTIVVKNEKSMVNTDLIRAGGDAFLKTQEDIYKKQAAANKSKSYIKSYEYTVYDRAFSGRAPWVYSEEICKYIDNNKNYTSKTKALMYNCDSDDSCFANVMMTSPDDTLENNSIVYNQVVESLR